MEKFSPELRTFLNLLDKKEKMTAMLAPSFPIDFSYPKIVGKLKRLGFTYIVEVARGAMETNRQLLKAVIKNPHRRFITTPCPVIVRLIRNKYPELKSYLAPVYSPMVNTAKLVLERFPGTRPVFIGPCPPKRFEAKEDFPELKIVILTFKELKQVFKMKKVGDKSSDTQAAFDMTGPETRLYPISGGLAESCGLSQILTDEQYQVVSGPRLSEEFLKNFLKNKTLRVLDILYCEGGCIAGQGIATKLSLDKRREKVIFHWNSIF